MQKCLLCPRNLNLNHVHAKCLLELKRELMQIRQEVHEKRLKELNRRRLVDNVVFSK